MPTSIHDQLKQSDVTSQHLLKIASRIIPVSVIDKHLTGTQVYEQRRRDLPAFMVFWLCLLAAWYPRRALETVLKRLLEVPSLFINPMDLRLPSRSAISQARYRLGAKVFADIFHEIARPLAQQPTPFTHRFGLHLVAIDTTVETVADTPQNAAYFGRSSNQYGDSAYPSLRAAYLCECGSHAIFDAAFGPYRRGDIDLAWRLRRSLTDNMLVMMDQGLISFDFVREICHRHSHVLAPPRYNATFTPYQYLSDGTFLAWMYPTQSSQDRHAEPILVRVITYTIDDPASPHHGVQRRLITTLLDPELYPAIDLIVLYHERWEIEITIDEIDTHQRLPNQPFRSHKPVGVIQEFYAMLLAHFILRTVMMETAQDYQLDPDRLSFSFTLCVMCDAIPYFQLFPPAFHDHLWRWVMAWITQQQLPPRRLRWNPRVIKRHRSKFKRKQPEHLKPPKPTYSFQASIVLT